MHLVFAHMVVIVNMIDKDMVVISTFYVIFFLFHERCLLIKSGSVITHQHSTFQHLTRQQYKYNTEYLILIQNIFCGYRLAITRIGRITKRQTVLLLPKQRNTLSTPS